MTITLLLYNLKSIFKIFYHWSTQLTDIIYTDIML